MTREFKTRISPHENIDQWVDAFGGNLEQAVDRPIKEVFSPEACFGDWRLSYGIQANDPTVYFLAFYPPFCAFPKSKYHYKNVAELAKDALALENYLVDVKTHKDVDAQDVMACAFSILRGKESIELFQEQKDLMELGLLHYHLDNYYQDHIKGLCDEYYEKGTILGKSFTLTILGNSDVGR